MAGPGVGEGQPFKFTASDSSMNPSQDPERQPPTDSATLVLGLADSLNGRGAGLGPYTVTASESESVVTQ